MNVIDQANGTNWHLYRGDCCEVLQGLPDESIDYSIFSPPFASLYVYSDSERDMGNCGSDEEFFEHYAFLAAELFRLIAPGRLVSVHCMNLPSTIQHNGYIGIRDFRGEIIRSMQKVGFIYHSEVCIWKDPVVAMQRTKALGLLHKQIVKDSCMSRQGIPDYVCTFRKPGKNAKPVSGKFDRFIGDQSTFGNSQERRYKQAMAEWRQYQTIKTESERLEYFDCGGKEFEKEPQFDDFKESSDLSIDVWQRYASPVWMDIDQSRTLNGRLARDEADERHICPLQLDVIERCMELWSNEGDVVLSPFAGVGSEGVVSIQSERKFVGVELKESYFKWACTFLGEEEERIEKEAATPKLAFPE